MHRVQVGSDEVERRGQGLLIRAAHEMTDWKFSKHRPAVVRYEGRLYQVGGTSRHPDGRHEYRLEPYEDKVHQYPSIDVEYGLDYVEAREAARSQLEKRKVEAIGWWLVYPLLGFLPCRAQLWLSDRYGFDPRAITGLALGVEFLAVLVLGTLSILYGFPPGMILIVMVLLADVLVRHANYSLGGAEQLGFYEWLLRLRLTPGRISTPVDRLGRRIERER